MEFLPLGLDLDGNIPRQTRLMAHLQEVMEFRAHEHALRLWARGHSIKELRNAIQGLRHRYPQPWLMFFGSGDFHHVTLVLLETLPKMLQPVTLVLIDHHPDWFVSPPRYHCGNWVAGALRLPGVNSVVLVGQGSADLAGHQFWFAPFGDLCRGRLQLIPYATSRIRVPLRWPATVDGVASSIRRWYGVELYFDTIAAHGITQVFDGLAERLSGCRVYLSIDKDCLQHQFAITDWDQGQLSLDDLLKGIQRLQRSVQIVGIDVCGDAAPSALRGLFKRIDAGRVTPRSMASKENDGVNEQTNLSLLEAFSTK